MSKIYTKVEIRFNKKKGCYIISIEYKDGEWQTGMSGSKIYIIGEYYVLTGWGSGEPIAVFTSKEQIKYYFKATCGINPEIIEN